ncbi:hypothetical protein LEP1GSC087_4735 [Leptospira interrogans serovar Bataviae str. L1111]|uniref:hypothetical protein n=1 Tax=Leptospira interrogans TaxID=173 RepID=UPI00029852F4|nr:hypothetical protein [Leptospira interrogans]EKR26006.1 hypothetical protein LEP1GSC087_4735 [Leptospira interrogans serovar Bataviae str. L1111]
MGKQIAVIMTKIDESSFLDFLKSISEIQILKADAPSASKDAFMIDDFSKDHENDFIYYIWNKSFPWNFEFSQTKTNRTKQNFYYIENIFEAPCIEYSRHNFNEKQNYGRLYWSKNFATINPLQYDIMKFDKWYNQIIRWVKKNGKQKYKGTLKAYYLPDAWKAYVEKI